MQPLSELFPEIPNIYSFPSVHADMLFDKRRVDSYQRAIEEIVKPGDVVADLGAGTGILSFLCLKAGAARVHAIERSEVIEWAKKIAEENGFSDRICFHHEDVREVELDENVDVLVSELIGHLAFEEGMIDIISEARNRFLKQDGACIPYSVVLKSCLVDEKEIYPYSLKEWSAVGGVDFSYLRKQALDNVYITSVGNRDLYSLSEIITSWQFEEEPKNIKREIIFRASRKGIINGLALWFDASLTPTFTLSSSPWSETHWEQCYLPFSDPVEVLQEEGVVVEMIFEINRAQANLPKIKAKYLGKD